MNDAESHEPRATVVVTCHNQAAWITQALDSVANQTERSIQLIVTDDGSTDGSVTVIERWLEEHFPSGQLVASDVNVGLPAILNQALPLFRGKYVVVLNGDDWMEPSRIEEQASLLDDARQPVGAAYCDLREVDAQGIPTGEIRPPRSVPRPEGDLLPHLISGPLIGMGVVMVRREVFETIGEWDSTLVADDFDFLLRLAAAGVHFTHLPELLVNYRIYGTSMTDTRHGELAEGRFIALRKLMGRDAETDRAILRRMEGLVVSLHGVGYDRRTTRSLVWYVLRRRRTKRLTRVLLENLLHLAPGRLVGRRAHAVADTR